MPKFIFFVATLVINGDIHLESLSLSKLVTPKYRNSLCSGALSIASAAALLTPPPVLQQQCIAPAIASVAPLADVGLGQYLVKDGKQLLRLSLPSGENGELGTAVAPDPGRKAQEALETIRLRFEETGPTNPSVFGGALKDFGIADAVISGSAGKSGNAMDSLSKKSSSSAAIAQGEKVLRESLQPHMRELEDALRKRDYKTALALDEVVCEELYTVRAAQLGVNTKGYRLPYTIPAEYNPATLPPEQRQKGAPVLPVLSGVAEVDLTVRTNRARGFLDEDGLATIGSQAVLRLRIDGLHAPLTAGNFLDLVDRKFYDGMKVPRVEELSLQFGGADTSRSGSGGGADGTAFIDPVTKMPRLLPLELFYKRDKEPTYGVNSDDGLRALDTPALPFQAYGQYLVHTRSFQSMLPILFFLLLFSLLPQG